MRKERRKRGSKGQRPDKYDLYQRSVQEPESDVRFLNRVFRTHFGRAPRSLREDFCGTAALACEWVSQHAENRAWGIDIDPEPLIWCENHNLPRLEPQAVSRVTLLKGDVRETTHEPVDITVAFNFSYFCFKTRSELRDYFAKARSSLGPRGLFAIDVYGGSDAQKRLSETRDHDGFDYIWDQDEFDPITHDVVNYIHFKVPGQKRMKRAFTYRWRLWFIPELRELMMEAGFEKTEVYWEGTDHKTNEGNGVFTKREHAPDDPAWIAYVIASG